jgi:hypothetical protein
LALSQHANDLSAVIISSVQCTVQENQVPNSSRAKNDFNARTLGMVLIRKKGSTRLFPPKL